MADARVHHGVFLRPDPRTCLAVTTVANQVRAQFGATSASAFPPHGTLGGSLPVGGRAPRLIAAPDRVLGDTAAFPVENRGVARMGDTLIYDLHRRGDGPNGPLRALAARIAEAVLPRLEEPDTGPEGGVGPVLFAPGRWHAHVSLASHDLFGRPELADEVQEYVDGLEVPVPRSFPGDHVALRRFTAPAWTGRTR